MLFCPGLIFKSAIVSNLDVLEKHVYYLLCLSELQATFTNSFIIKCLLFEAHVAMTSLHQCLSARRSILLCLIQALYRAEDACSVGVISTEPTSYCWIQRCGRILLMDNA